MLLLKTIRLRKSTRIISHLSKKFHMNITQKPELDLEYLCSPNNFEEIAKNIAIRKGVGNIKLVHELKQKLESENDEKLRTQFHSELLKIPNRTHPDVIKYEDEPKITKVIGEKPIKDSLIEFQEITKKLKLVRTDQLGNLSGSKSYYLLGEMAELEHALIRYVVSKLLQNKFQLISVPDILHRDMVEGCGMNTKGSRTQVYSLDENLHGPNLCLSGTSEISLAGYLSNKTIPEKQLPLKLAAISRCYRAETSNLLEERGIYRVHEFNKVEMFIVAQPEQSPELLEDIRSIQEDIFSSLGLHFKVLDMPPHELGAQAYRKYDIEAWLVGRQIYGEISSCSNCLDYQSRRLAIKYEKNGSFGFVHTLNGTACAVPRLLIALVENGQNKNGTVSVPDVLQKYMNGKKFIGKQKNVPELKLIKNKKYCCLLFYISRYIFLQLHMSTAGVAALFFLIIEKYFYLMSYIAKANCQHKISSECQCKH